MSKEVLPGEKPDNGPDDNQADSARPDETRRKLTKAGLTAPVLMTLAARPVWGQSCSLSGQLSGNLSDAHEPCGGEGCTKDVWLNLIGAWSPHFSPSMAFAEAFGVDAFPGASLIEVLQGVATPDIPANCADFGDKTCEDILNELGMEAVAALQNSATSVSYDLTVAEVIASFVNSYNNGSMDALMGTSMAFSSFNNQACPLASKGFIG